MGNSRDTSLQVILDTALPFFAVILSGWLALRWRLVDEDGVRGLNGFVFWIALPALLVSKVAEAPLERVFDGPYLLAYYVPALAIYALVFGVGVGVQHLDRGHAALRALGAVWGNTGFMGIPLLLSAFGPEWVIPVVVALFLDMTISQPLTVAILESRRGRGVAALRQTAVNLARNPLVIAVLVGLLMAILGLGMPKPVDSFLHIVGAAASPCALFALGGALVGVPISHGKRDLAWLSLLKLVGHPALVWIVGTTLVPLDPKLLHAAVITAALPTATTVFVLAQRYDVFVLRSSTLVLVTHAASVVTLSVLLALFSG